MLKVVKNDYEKWELLLRVLTGELAEDSPIFQSWLAQSEENKELYQSLKDQNNNENLMFDLDRMYKNIAESLSFASEEKEKISLAQKIPQWMKFASAIAILLISASVFFWINKPDRINVTQIDNTEIIEPGGKKARLILADGKAIDLTNDFNIEKQDGTIIVNESEGGLSYERKSDKIKPEYHTIEVPIGGEYQLRLDDGTKVYLNSGTRLRYPSYFEGKDRNVELEGEAYFEVTKNEKPFIVHTSNLDIKVLGTSFNISAYEEDSQVNATLVNGKVQVMTKHNTSVYDLTPGYNLNYQKKSKAVVTQKVDVEFYTAWVRGEFIFKNQNLEDILTQLSRWYDFSVEYQDQSLRNMKFTGGAEKKRSINYMLKQIEVVTNIKFKEDGKRIIIYK